MRQIEKFLTELFENCADTAHNKNLKENIRSGLIEKANDLEEEGLNKIDAQYQVIAEFGAVSEIREELGIESKTTPKNVEMAKLNFGFSLWGSSLIILLFLFINFYYYPGYIWFVYPTFAILWWPSAMFYVMKKKGWSKK